jgi:hypothetical protein
LLCHATLSIVAYITTASGGNTTPKVSRMPKYVIRQQKCGSKKRVGIVVVRSDEEPDPAH